MHVLPVCRSCACPIRSPAKATGTGPTASTERRLRTSTECCASTRASPVRRQRRDERHLARAQRVKLHSKCASRGPSNDSNCTRELRRTRQPSRDRKLSSARWRVRTFNAAAIEPRVHHHPREQLPVGWLAQHRDSDPHAQTLASFLHGSRPRSEAITREYRTSSTRRQLGKCRACSYGGVRCSSDRSQVLGTSSRRTRPQVLIGSLACSSASIDTGREPLTEFE